MLDTGLRGSLLSFKQMRLWSLSQKRPIHNPQCSFLLEGSLNIELFEQAIVQVMQRHEILHTLFYQAPGMEIPVQVVSENVKVSYQIISLMHLDEAAKAVQLDEHFARLQELSYDLEQGPLWRVWLLRLTPQRHVVLLGCSGLCADAASLPLLLQAWRQAYSGVPWQEEEPLQYADVAQWRLELAEDAQLQEGRHYWQALPLEEFARQPLPYQRSGSWSPASPDGQEERREHYYELELDLEQARVLEQCSQQQQVWRETVLLAGWLALWWRLTQQDQPRLGVQADGRPYEELGGVLGPCSELLPLQIELVAGLSWQHLLQRVQRVLQEGREHQLAFAGIPGEQQALAVSFRYLNWPQQSWAPGVHSRLLRLSNWPEAVALSLLVLDLGETVRLHLRSGRLAGSDLARLAGQLARLLEAGCREPQQAVSRLSWLSEQERAWLREQGQGAPSRGNYQELWQAVEQTAQQQPDRLALVEGQQQLSYGCLNRRVQRLARRLRAAGVGPQHLVGLWLPRSLGQIEALLGVLRAGGGYVPIEQEQPAERVAHLLQQVRPLLLLTQPGQQQRLPGWTGPWLLLDEHEGAEAAEPPDEQAAEEAGSILPQSIAYVIGTSGSTGRPKGVMVSRANLWHYTQAITQRLQLPPGGHYATISTLAADLGNTALVAALSSGGCLHMLCGEQMREAGAFARRMREWPIDVLKIVPSHLSALLAGTKEALGERLPRRWLVLGGEAVSGAVLQQVWQEGGECRVLNHYGPTETTVGAVSHEVRREEGWQEGASVIGRPLGGGLGWGGGGGECRCGCWTGGGKRCRGEWRESW